MGPENLQGVVCVLLEGCGQNLEVFKRHVTIVGLGSSFQWSKEQSPCRSWSSPSGKEASGDGDDDELVVMDSSACSALVVVGGGEWSNITDRMGASTGTHVRTHSYGTIGSQPGH